MRDGLARLFDPPAARKARGAFFTPEPLCQFVTEWAVRKPSDRIFEPSCGEAAFLLAAGARLRELGAIDRLDGQLAGVELHEPSAASARQLLDLRGWGSTITAGDFFQAELEPTFDAVLGNPPYVRYQDHTGAARARSQAAALSQGVRLNGLASSWAAFVVHSAQVLAPGGRMGLVLPGELLTVSYAAEVRSFLLRRFERVRLVMFEERVFPDVSEEVVLLLAEGEGGTDHFELYQARDLSDLIDLGDAFRVWRPNEAGGKWLSALLPSEAVTTYEELRHGELFETLADWGTPSLGMVTGNNKYFAISAATANRHHIAERDLLRISPPGSKHLRGLTFSDAAWRQMVTDGAAGFLFYPSEDPSPGAVAYIAAGEAEDVQQAYKCRMRRPWHRVPLQAVPDLFLTYMNHDAPRLVRNEAKVRHINSIHGVRLHRGRKTLGAELLPLALLNSASLLGAEIVGRSYGGGLLKLEPKEGGRVPLPSPALLEAAAEDLRAIRPQLGQHLRGGKLTDAIELVDNALLVRHAGLSRAAVKRLREARLHLFDRRVSRSGKRRAAE